MSNQVNHEIANDGRRLTFHAGSGITYKDDATTEYRGKAVSISGNATVVLAADGAALAGAIEVVEPPDPVSTKVGVHVEGVVTFINSDEADPVTPGAQVVGAGDGDIRDATTGDEANARGFVTQVVGNKIHVVFP